MLVVGAFWLLPTLLKKFQQRQQERDAANAPAAPDSPRPPASQGDPAPTTDWEEQLRRLLEGESPAPARPAESWERPIPVPAPPPLPPAPQRVVTVRTQPRLPGKTDTLEAATRAYFKAGQVDAKTENRFRNIDAQVSDHKPVPVRSALSRRSPAVVAALRQLNTPSSVQQAMVAAMILGPPRALESPEN